AVGVGDGGRGAALLRRVRPGARVAAAVRRRVEPRRLIAAHAGLLRRDEAVVLTRAAAGQRHGIAVLVLPLERRRARVVDVIHSAVAEAADGRAATRVIQELVALAVVVR